MDEELPLYSGSRYVNGLRADVRRYRLAWTSARRRADLYRQSNQVRGWKLDVAMESGRRYKAERDEARAEVVRLGRENTRLIEEVRTLREQPIRQGSERAS